MKSNYLLKMSVAVIALLLASCGGNEEQLSFRVYKMEVTDIRSGSASTSKYYYDDLGFTVKRERDQQSDGIVDFVVTYIYKDSRVVESNSYHASDDAYERKTFYYYNGENILIRMTTEDPLSGAAGDYSDFGYDQFNRLVTADIYDSVGNLTASYTYSYTSENLMDKVVSDTGDVDKFSYVLNENGRIYKIEQDSNQDGQADIVTVLYYEEGACVVPEVKSIRMYHCSNI